MLAAQLIARYFKYFPEHGNDAFESIIDLCESPDVDLRKHATLAMIAICRDCPEHVTKASDILIQLYQTNHASEVNLINQSLLTLLNLDVKNFLKSFFANFEDGSEMVRERALKFLSSKIHTLSESQLTKDVEELLMTYSKKAMDDVTKDEFIILIGILSKLKVAKTATGQAMIVLVIKAQAELNKPFNVDDKDSLDKFLLCTKHTIPFLSQYNRASEYLDYMCTKMLPNIKSLESSGADLHIMQAMAEMSPYIHDDDVPTLIDLKRCQQEVWTKLSEYLPLPQEPNKNDASNETDAEKPIDGTETAAANVQEQAPAKDDADTDGNNNADNETDFKFTHIEYLIYTFHQFGRIRPEFYSESLQNDYKLRLQHLALGCTKYMDILSAHLREVKSSEDHKKEENVLKSVALRTTKNISTLVKDLFKKPPQFKSQVLLSCKPLAPKPSESAHPNNQNKSGQQRGGDASNRNVTNGRANGAGRYAGQKHKFRHNSSNDRNHKRTRAR